MQARHVVFGCACGAASNTSKTLRKATKLDATTVLKQHAGQKTNTLSLVDAWNYMHQTILETASKRSQSTKLHATTTNITSTCSQKVIKIRQQSTPGGPLGFPGTPAWAKIPRETLIWHFLAPFWTPLWRPKTNEKNPNILLKNRWGHFICSWPPFGLPRHLQKETKKGANTQPRKSVLLYSLLIL